MIHTWRKTEITSSNYWTYAHRALPLLETLVQDKYENSFSKDKIYQGDQNTGIFIYQAKEEIVWISLAEVRNLVQQCANYSDEPRILLCGCSNEDLNEAYEHRWEAFKHAVLAVA